MDCGAPPSEDRCSEDEVLYECPELKAATMTTHYSSDSSLSSYLVDENYVYDGLPSDKEETREEPFMERLMVTTMTTTPIIQSAKKNTEKPPFGLEKASDGTLLTKREIRDYETLLKSMGYVNGKPPKNNSNQVSTCFSSQPVTLGTLRTLKKPSESQTLNSGLMKKNNEPISTLRIKEKSLTKEIPPKCVKASNGTTVRLKYLNMFEQMLKDKENRKSKRKK
ncbi:Hypothetical predicted protein [Pelobates cultripes]|uniref:Uncharacterized protein n=1 Tax=Pelobates cultripes TaxID=61616 RepID=A0AAD1VMW1_PELCU|nr:Hypothetical predicted protein [Pelobates cultripes]